MLFKKKDQNESSKAKTALFASKAKQDEAHEKEEVRKAAPSSKKSQKADEHADEKALKTTVAAGKTNANILRRPRITEKASVEAGKNVYTFDVARTATKTQIKEAVKDVYRVTPVAVRIVTIPEKRVVSRRGHKGVISGGKKAYVYLKKGDTIELV